MPSNSRCWHGCQREAAFMPVRLDTGGIIIGEWQRRMPLERIRAPRPLGLVFGRGGYVPSSQPVLSEFLGPTHIQSTGNGPKHFGGLVVLGVGPRTDMYVLRHRKPVIQVQEKIIEGKLIQFCRDLEPPTLTQKHVSVLNQIGGFGFSSIKKLTAMRQNGLKHRKKGIA